MKLQIVFFLCAFKLIEAQYPLVNGTCTLCPALNLTGVDLTQVKTFNCIKKLILIVFILISTTEFGIGSHRSTILWSKMIRVNTAT
jgi:hypothetical protein